MAATRTRPELTKVERISHYTFIFCILSGFLVMHFFADTDYRELATMFFVTMWAIAMILGVLTTPFFLKRVFKYYGSPKNINKKEEE